MDQASPVQMLVPGEAPPDGEALGSEQVLEFLFAYLAPPIRAPSGPEGFEGGVQDD